jgi:hypothetical protein
MVTGRADARKNYRARSRSPSASAPAGAHLRGKRSGAEPKLPRRVDQDDRQRLLAGPVVAERREPARGPAAVPARVQRQVGVEHLLDAAAGTARRAARP